MNGWTSFLVMGCGVLFLIEAWIGFFRPNTYEFLEPASRAERPFRLPLIGSILFTWGVICIGSSVPPDQTVDWILVILGAPLIYKGVLIAFFPEKLKENPDHIRATPKEWKAKCGLRFVIGSVLFVWGMILI